MTPQEAAAELRHIADLFCTPAAKQAALMGAEALENRLPRDARIVSVARCPGGTSSCAWGCPSCGKNFPFPRGEAKLPYQSYEYDYCPDCGQSLKYSREIVEAALTTVQQEVPDDHT
jgi:hypothetical protein